jgi:hypothetical protein
MTICQTSENSAGAQPVLIRRFDAIHCIEIEGDGAQFNHHTDFNATDHPGRIPFDGWTCGHIERRCLLVLQGYDFVVQLGAVIVREGALNGGKIIAPLVHGERCAAECG